MSTFQWLWLMIGLQLILFAVGWWSSAHRATTSRAAMQGLALFNLGMGVSTALIGLRGVLPYALTHPLSNLLSLASFVVLWRAAQALTGKRFSTREQLAVLLVGGAMILWFGRSPELGQQRVAVFFVVSGWIALHGGWQAFERLRLESRPRPAWALLVICWGMAALFVWRAWLGLSNEAEIQFNQASGTTNTLALVLMVAVFSVNMVYAQIVFGRTTAELQRLSRHDPLTGLFNRRAIVEALDIEWQRFQRSAQAFSVASIDIDNFKAVNDGFGHAAGDNVLVGVAQQLRHSLRPGDHIGRIGGEEFLVLLYGCEPGEALVAAERLRMAVCEKAGLHPGADQRVTISIGVATAGAEDVDIDALLARADAALYASKHAGRNTVSQAAPARLAARHPSVGPGVMPGPG